MERGKQNETSEPETSKDLYLDNLLKKISENPQSRKTQTKYHRASSDCEHSDEEPEVPSLTREQALKLTYRKKIEEKVTNKI